MAHSVLITGASSGIGAVYADRFAKRGHDLVLVARNHDRMISLAARLHAENGVAVDLIAADLTDDCDLRAVEARLHEDARIGILVNNAGAAPVGKFLDHVTEDVTRIINLNVLAVTRLAMAAAPRFVAAGDGAIINMSSVLGWATEIGYSVYGATKAYVLFFSQSLHFELGPKGVYVQTVVPPAVRTEIWERSRRNVDDLPAVMEVDELVDAALAGFDRREAVTIPSLADEAQWTAFDTARRTIIPNVLQKHAAKRYLTEKAASQA